MKSQTKAPAASAAKWALGLSGGYVFGPIVYRLASGAELSGNFVAQRLVVGIAWFFIIFFGLWLRGIFSNKDPIADASNQSSESTKSTLMAVKAEAIPVNFEASPISRSEYVSTTPGHDIKDGSQNRYTAAVVLIALASLVAIWLTLSKTPTPDDAVVAVVSKPWTPLSNGQLMGIYAEPVLRPDADREKKSGRPVKPFDFDSLLGISKAESAQTRERQRLADKGNLSQLQNAAQDGDALAQFQLSGIYYRGYAVHRNLQLSSHWMWMAAVQGSIEAQKDIASTYQLENYLDAGPTKMLAWFLLAAEQGDAEAQSLVSRHYYVGSGTPKNYQIAMRWALSAAQQGMPDGQFMVGVLYRDGDGVKKDLVQAHKWLNLAAATGSEVAVRERNQLEKVMSSDQISEAQGLASAWKATK